MDRIINRHIDELDELERQMEIIIDHELSQLDIDDIISNPQAALEEAATNIKEVFLDEYADKAVEMGFAFGRAVNKRIEQDKEIVIDDSTNPKLNADKDDSKKQD